MILDYSNWAEKLDAILATARDYQRRGILFMSANKKVLLDSPPGTGKSLMALAAAFDQQPQKILFICSKNALNTWRKELKKWFPEFVYRNYNIIEGTKAKRAKLWAIDTNYYACTYATYRIDKDIVNKMKFDCIICDEVDRSGVRNRKSAMVLNSRPLFLKAPFAVMASGTFISKGPHQLWAALNLLYNKLFTSYWAFVNKYCEIEEGMFGNRIVDAKNADGFARVTKDIIFKVPQEVADKELPPITRQYIDVTMTPKQAAFYKSMYEEMYSYTEDGDMVISSTQMAAEMRIRQGLSCPRALGIDCDGAGIETVVDMALDFEDSHLVVFTPFKANIPIFKAYLAAKLGVPAYSLQGGVGPDEMAETIAAWKKSKGVMVCSTKFSQSFELETARRCYHVGFEWDPADNEQADARIRRLISPGPVWAYYLVYVGSEVCANMQAVNQGKRRIIKNTYHYINKRQLEELSDGTEESKA